MYVCLYVCLCVCIYVCIYVCIFLCIYVYIYVCIQLGIQTACIHVCMFVSMNVCMYLCIYSCMYASRYLSDFQFGGSLKMGPLQIPRAKFLKRCKLVLLVENFRQVFFVLKTVHTCFLRRKLPVHRGADSNLIVLVTFYVKTRMYN